MIADLTGRTALVTGAGTPNGMGAGIARVLVAQGARVAFADLVIAASETIAADDSGAKVLALELDVASDRSVEDAFESVLETWGRLDILVNNAGIGGARQGHDESEWDGTFAVNVKGTVRCCEYALRSMRPRGYGKIINIPSISGHSARGTAGAYRASKAAILRYMKGLAFDVAPDSVNVYAVCPAAIWTEMQINSFGRPDTVDPPVLRTRAI